MVKPAWQPGQRLNASDVNTWMVPNEAYKTGSTSRSSVTTLRNDPDMVLALGVGVYALEAFIRYNGPTSNALAWTFSCPASTAGAYTVLMWNSLNVDVLETHSWTDSMASYSNGTGTEYSLTVQGLLRIRTAGDFVFQWAQKTSSGTSTSVDAGSYAAAWQAS